MRTGKTCKVIANPVMLPLYNTINMLRFHRIALLWGNIVFKPIRLSIALGATICSTFAMSASRAEAYQIDCAILLCLSGGWPSSAECTAARAVFIHRITPWPVEPPLQIWRCPMGNASASPTGESIPTRFARIVDELGLEPGPASVTASNDPAKEDAFTRALTAIGSDVPGFDGSIVTANFSDVNGTADIDISSTDFDFVRSIRVYDVEWHEWNHENNRGENDCRRGRQRVRVGSYGVQGDFAWRNTSVTTATNLPWLGFTTRQDHNCNHAGSFRGIGVEWRDYEGNHGYEVVRY